MHFYKRILIVALILVQMLMIRCTMCDVFFFSFFDFINISIAQSQAVYKICWQDLMADVFSYLCQTKIDP